MLHISKSISSILANFLMPTPDAVQSLQGRLGIPENSLRVILACLVYYCCRKWHPSKSPRPHLVKRQIRSTSFVTGS